MTRLPGRRGFLTYKHQICTLRQKVLLPWKRSDLLLLQRPETGLKIPLRSNISPQTAKETDADEFEHQNRSIKMKSVVLFLWFIPEYVQVLQYIQHFLYVFRYLAEA